MNATTPNHEEKIEAARAYVLQKAPYFSSVVYGFVYRPIEGIGTMLCTPTMILGYDPEWAVIATVDELAADIAHEVHHFKRGHFERGETVDDKDLFNKAGDLAINPDMKAAGWKLEEGPMGAIYPEMYGLPPNLSTEEYYQLLRQQKQKQGKTPEPKGVPTPTQGKPQSGPGGTTKPGEGPPKLPGMGPPGGGGDKDGKEEGKGSGHGKGGICKGHCGGLGGNAEQKELEQKLDSLPGVGRSKSEQKVIEKRLANDIKEYMEVHGRGSVPASMQDWTKVFDDEPHVRWQDELSQVMRDTTGRLQAGGDDFSMRRPSKRSILRGFPRPGLIEHLPEVAIIRDSSMSMGAKQLTASVRESYFIMQALGIEEVWFVDADTDLSMPWKRVGADFFRTLTEVRGRGGTDFRRPINSALELVPRPDLLVYATDGDGTVALMPPPDIAVVWCIVPSYFNKAPAKWGHCVIVSDDPKVRKKGVTYPNDQDDDDGDAIDAISDILDVDP